VDEMYHVFKFDFFVIYLLILHNMANYWFCQPKSEFFPSFFTYYSQKHQLSVNFFRLARATLAVLRAFKMKFSGYLISEAN
jgi:hypothetical protein